MIVSNYLPGKIYKVKVSVNNLVGTPVAYGFQLVSIIDKNFNDIKDWSNLSSNSKIVDLTNGNKRRYLEQIKKSTSNIFEAKWKAPTFNTGKVSFYVSGNGVNGNGNISGDAASTAVLNLSEATTSNFNDIEIKLNIFPTISNGIYNISGFNENMEIEVIDITGKKVKYTNFNNNLNITDSLNGIYLIHVLNNNRLIHSQKIIKQ